MPSTTPRLLIHVGYRKTGSTWLQKCVFNDKQAGFLSPWGSPVIKSLADLTSPDTSCFSAKSVRKGFEPGLEEAANLSLVAVLSNEELIGRPHKGCYWGKDIANRIHAVFPDARILICIREQQSMIKSEYSEQIKGGETLTLQQLLGLQTSKATSSSKFQLEHFKYDLLIEYYQKIFGKDNILVLPVELLKKDQHAFSQRLLSFVGSEGKISYSQEPKNVGFKAGRLVVQRQLNFLAKPIPINQAQQPLSWLLACKLSAEFERFLPQGIHERIEKRWQRLIAERVGDYFRESNKRASQLIGIDLASFGYKC